MREPSSSGGEEDRRKADRPVTPMPTQELESVVIRFAGDSGDGMQLTGGEFTRAAVLHGNDVATYPDFPAEIRAPAGSLAGVSGFQLQFASKEIYTAGDAPEVLVVMNPAALRTNLAQLEPGGMLLVDSGAFKRKNLELAGYETNPLEDGSLDSYRVLTADFSKQVTTALHGSGLSTKEINRTRNFFALGILFWLYDRQIEPEIQSIERTFARRPQIVKANIKALEQGYYYGETTEIFQARFHVAAAKLDRGHYRNIMGNEATAMAIAAAALLADRPVFYGSYPITPASDILERLSSLSRYGVTTFQAEDEIAAVGAAIGASFGGSIAVTGTSGPGFILKQEGIGLAVAAELPLVVINVQRAGPSTGMPTKPEQADLLQVLYGRNGESPLAVVAPASPGDCFEMTLQAIRLATEHMCPVVVLSDGSLANGSEPWAMPDPSSLEPIRINYCTEAKDFVPYSRNPETLARPWAIPGTPGLEHRIGGLEREDLTGNVCYEPLNHERMVRLRQAKIDRMADRLPPAQVFGEERGDLLLVGWGGTYGTIYQATRTLREEGHSVSHLHLRYLNPLQSNVGELLGNFERVLVVELNLGQLRWLLRARFLVPALGLNKVQGQPFHVREVIEASHSLLAGDSIPEVSP